MGFFFFLLFIAFIFLLIYLSTPAGRAWRDQFSVKARKTFSPANITIIIVIVLLIVIIPQAVVIVHPGEMTVKFNRFSPQGNLSTLSQGFKIIVPFIYKLDKYDVRIQEYTMSIAANEGRKTGDDSVWSPTSEGLQVGVDVTVWYRIDPDKLADIHKTLGKEFEEKIIRPSIRSLIRNVVSQYKVMELYSLKRNEVQSVLLNNITDDLKSIGFIVEKLLLRDIIFPKEFERSIEEKQIAEQQAQKMDYVLEKERKEAERKKIEADGEATKINSIETALRKSPNYIKYLYVEKLAGNIKVIVSDQSTIMNLDNIINEESKRK